MAAPAIVRTVVPIIIGALLSFLATYDIHVDTATEHALNVGLTGLFSAAYYVLAYALESRWPIAGYLLGSNARPNYAGGSAQASTGPATAMPGTPEDRL